MCLSLLSLGAAVGAEISDSLGAGLVVEMGEVGTWLLLLLLMSSCFLGVEDASLAWAGGGQVLLLVAHLFLV